MAKVQWKKAGKGLEYYNHATKKHGVKFDRYFRGRYTVDGNTTTVSFGWESEWVAGERARTVGGGNGLRRSFLEYCTGELARLKENARKGSGPTTIKEERQLAEIQRKRAEQIQEAEQRESITFGEYFENTYYPIAQTTKKKRSYEQELSHFKHWLSPVIGDMRFGDIKPMHLERVKRNMLNATAISKKKKPKRAQAKKQPRSPRMIQYVFATGRQCWNYARRDGFASGEWPGKEVRLPKVENQRIRFLTDEEGDQLLDGLIERSKQLYDICLLSFDVGLRANEIFSLTWNRIDLNQKTVKVLDSKGRDRVVYLTDRAADMLSHLPQAGEYVFMSRKGEKIKEVSNSFNREVDSLRVE